jgi:hypothetical protein
VQDQAVCFVFECQQKKKICQKMPMMLIHDRPELEINNLQLVLKVTKITMMMRLKLMFSDGFVIHFGINVSQSKSLLLTELFPHCTCCSDFIQKEIKRLCASSLMHDETAIGASKATEETLHRGLPMGWEVGTGVPGV